MTGKSWVPPPTNALDTAPLCIGADVYTFGGGVVMPRLLLSARPARGLRGRVGHGGVELSYEGPNGLAVSADVQSCGNRVH